MHKKPYSNFNYKFVGPEETINAILAKKKQQKFKTSPVRNKTFELLDYSKSEAQVTITHHNYYTPQ